MRVDVCVVEFGELLCGEKFVDVSQVLDEWL